jgi:hypothetical protein
MKHKYWFTSSQEKALVAHQRSFHFGRLQPQLSLQGEMILDASATKHFDFGS